MSAQRFYAKLLLKIFFLSGFIFFSLTGSAAAQNLTPQEIETSVEKISKFVSDNYVFAEKGKDIAANFLQEKRDGKFNKAKNWLEFASRATEALRAFSGDGHLYVRYDPQQVKELTAPVTGKSEVLETENSFFYGLKSREKNYGFSKVEILEGNIGYLKLSEINISEKSLPVLIAAMRFVENTKALIVDLRDNSGGGSEVGAVLESFFLPKNTSLLEFKSRAGTSETSRTVAWLTEKKYDAPVFIIVNRKTGSAAEAFAFALQAKKRASIVGQNSAGAAHMNSWYPVNDYIYVSVSTAAPVLPGTETSWEGKGVQPNFPAEAGKEIEIIKKLIIKR